MPCTLFLFTGLAAGILIGASCSRWTAAGEGPATRAKVGEFSTVRIEQRGVAPALDFHLNGKARAIRFFTPEQKEPRAYFNESGQFYTNGWVTISGTMSGKGDGYNIVPPSLKDGRQDPAMLHVWWTLSARRSRFEPPTRTTPAAMSFKRWAGMASTRLVSNRTVDSAGARDLVPRWIPTSTVARQRR